MASGSFNISRTAGSTYCSYRVVWSSTANTASNSSAVTVWVYVDKSASSSAATSGTANTSVTIGSTTQTESGLGFSVSPGGSTLLFAKGGYTVAHADNGSGSATISVSIGGNIIGASGSSTVTLDTIARKATITSAPDFTDEANPKITYSNPAGNSVTTLQACISFTGAKDDIAYRDISKTGTSYTFNLTDTERQTLWTRVTSGSSNTVTFFVKTVISGVTYHSSLTKTLYLVNHEPTVTGTVRNVDEYTAQMLGDDSSKMIKGFNEIEFTINATGNKGATIVSAYCYNNGNRYTEGTNIVNTTNNNFTFFATDSRGNTNEYTVPVELTMYDYQPNYCTVEASGELTDSNKVDIKYTVSGTGFNGIINGHQHLPTLYIHLGETDGSSYTTISTTTANLEIDDFDENYNFTYSGTVRGDDYEKQYIIIAEISDWLTSDTAQSKTIVVVPVFDWSGADFNFNVPVSINNEPIADYVIERGTDDFWTYEKWASGKAVCYGVKNYGTIVATTAWGAFYESSGFRQSFPSDLFIEAPQHLNIQTQRGGACLMCGYGYSEPPTKDSTGLFFFFRPTAANVSQVYVMFYAIGRWR